MDSSAVGVSGEVDPFRAPSPTQWLGSVAARERVVVAGIVVRTETVGWVGGPVLEVELRDVTGSICLAFLGRKEIAGIHPGVLLTAAGTVGLRDGHLLVLNPQTWLGARAQRGPVVDIPAVTTTASVAGA